MEDSNIESFESKLSEARELYNSSKYSESYDKCLEICTIRHKAQYLVYSIMCSCSLNLEMFRRALGDINKCLRLNRSYPKAYEKKVDCLVKLKCRLFYVSYYASIAYTLNESIKSKLEGYNLKFEKFKIVSSFQELALAKVLSSKFLINSSGLYQISGFFGDFVVVGLVDNVVITTNESFHGTANGKCMFENVTWLASPMHNIFASSGSVAIFDCIFDHTNIDHLSSSSSFSFGVIGMTNSQVLLSGCSFINLRACAATCDSGGRLNVTNCTFKNVHMGVEYRSGGGGKVSRCKIDGSKVHGILVWQNPGNVIITDCTLERCATDSGILVQPGDSDIRIENTISRNHKLYGICVDGKNGGKGTVEIRNCEAGDNEVCGILIANGARANIDGCKLHSNKLCGLTIQFNGSKPVKISNCIITKNNGDGIATIKSSGKRLLCGNVIEKNGKESYTGKKKNKDDQSCNFCGRQGKKFQRCSGCQTALYCGSECQRKDWSVHKKKCKELQNRFVEIVEPAQSPPVLLEGSLIDSGKMKGKKPSKSSRKRFVVKIQTPMGPARYFEDGTPLSEDLKSIVEKSSNPKLLMLYDKTRSVKFLCKSEKLLRIIGEKGVARSGTNAKKAFFYAMFKEGDSGKLKIFYNVLAPFQDW